MIGWSRLSSDIFLISWRTIDMIFPCDACLLLLNIVASLFMGRREVCRWVSDAFDDDDLQFACAVLLAMRGGLKVLGRFVAGDRLLEARKHDDDEAAEFLRALEDLELAAARQELAAEFPDNRR